ncbi:MAG: T9SS type A sorting domain-containing protein [Bacteroidetes bacterium]|nr:T9SS type A sorting domain-containing protein [Bacteroidota bacterium]
MKLDDIDQPWIGTADKGLLYKNGSNFIVYDTANSPLTDVVIQCVNIDDSGKVWIGTQTGGLFILDPSLLTGISSTGTFTNVSVYPNPASDVLFYNSPFPTVSCEITDLSGRLLLSESGTSNQIDIHALSTGLYHVRFIYEDGNSITRKFLKQ